MSGIITQLCVTCQGEGSSVGVPCLLIRLGNCNLSCDFCDTKWTNKLKLNKIPKLTSVNDSVPFKVDKKSMHILMEIFQNHIKNYNIKTALITGGEPFIDSDFLANLIQNITNHSGMRRVEIETNGSLITEKALLDILDSGAIIQLNVSPKLDASFYTSEKINDISEIIELFQQKNKIIRNIQNVYRFSFSNIYKFVYSKKDEINISRFIDEVDLNGTIYIMPNTPDYTTYTDEFTFLQDFRESSYDSVDYCLRKGFIFSPRIHIWVFNNFNHRNEFESVRNI